MHAIRRLLFLAALVSVFIPGTGAAMETPVFATRTGERPAEVFSEPSIAHDEITTDRVRRTVEAILHERYPGKVQTLEVRVMRLESTAQTAQSLRARLKQVDSVPRGHTHIRLHALAENGWADVGWALLYVAHFDSVAIAKRDVASGEEVLLEDLTLGWMETTSFRGEPLRAADVRSLDDESMFARRPLRAGKAIRKGDLRESYAAQAGETITVTYRRAGIELKLRCQAREPGHSGDVIRAYNPDTKTIYLVELTGSGAAIWKSTL